MNIFLTPGLFKNIKRSIIDGVKIDDLDLRDLSLRRKILDVYRDTIIRLWALKESLYPQWRRINEGDHVLFYHGGKFIYVGEVSFKYPFEDSSEQVEIGSYLAEKIWGRDVEGRTWPYLIFLRNVREINLPLSKFNELTGYSLRFVRKFMKVREERTSRMVEYLQQVYCESRIESRHEPSQLTVYDRTHDQIVDYLYALGELIGYTPQRKWRHERYEFDVVWFKPPRVGPKYVFEIHLRGNLEAALLRLKHAYDLWESQIFLVSTEDKLKEAQTKFLGELHELTDKIVLVTIKDIEEFYHFKGRFEWLERKFGLRPR